MIRGGVSIDDLRLNKPVLYLRRDGDAWSITRLVKQQSQEADRDGPAEPIAIEAIGISDASVVIDDPVGTSGVDVPERIDRIDARLSFAYAPVHYTVEIDHVSFRASEPSFGVNSLSGGIAVRDDTIFLDRLSLRTEESSLSLDGAIEHYTATPSFNVRMSSDKLSIPEIARLVPALDGVTLQPGFRIEAAGPLDRLQVEMSVRSSAGEAAGRFIADVQAPGQSIAGDVSVRHLNLAPVLDDPGLRSDVTADARVDLRGAEFSDIASLAGTVDLQAPRAAAAGYAVEDVDAHLELEGRRVGLKGRLSAYGANLTTGGRVTLAGAGDPLSYDLSGRVAGVDLRQLPRDLGVPPASSSVTATYRVHGAETAARRVDADLRFDDSTIAGARLAGGSTAGVSLRGGDIAYRADAAVADLDLQRVGREFDVPALAGDRYASAINGRVTAEGRGTALDDLVVNATGTLEESSILGGRIPRLAFDASVAEDQAHVAAEGAFAGFDPAALSGRPDLKGSVAGTLDADATIAGLSDGVTIDSVAGSIQLSLEPSSVGGLAIERAAVDADYRDRTGEIRTLELTGRDLNLKASGTLALNETGQSDLRFEADSPSLETIGGLFDVPLSGIAKVAGTITGNRSELRAEGNVIGNGVEYEENGALALNSSFDARVPDLAFEQATVAAETDATFVTVAGQNINEVHAKTAYAAKQLTFDVTARQPERTVAAAGGLVLHPDHQEVHLQSLSLRSRGAEWQLVPGSEPTVNYAGNRVDVGNLQLVSGDQRIAADGAFGRPGDTLDVTLSGVSLENVDALLLRPPQFSGRLDATAEVQGTTEAPQVQGTFQVRDGAFRQFTYDSLTGTFDYAGATVAADVRLQQSANQWITAKGTIPTALFAGESAANPSDRQRPVDLTVDSSAIDLGIIQGFTTALTDVTGSFEAHLRVTGTADDPRPEGAITLQNGRMTVAPTGVTYTDVDGRIDLDGDRVRIERITVLDNHNSPLTISGELAVDARRLEGVQLSVTADDFKVIDNALGNVRIGTNLEIAGDLAAPRVEGSLAVTTGELNLDEIVALAGPSAYATKEIQYSDEEQSPMPGPLGALAVDVDVRVPDDLVVHADSLATPGSAFSLGALNVTLGGDLQVLKKPGDRLRLVGVVSTVRGFYDFQGRRFEILRDGSVRFEGLEELDPRLDIRTRRVIRAVEARVNVRGTLKQPEIQLSSTPPLEQADILSLIVFNQPINELGTGQQVTLAQRAQALATGAIAGQLAESIGDALHLDTFEINLAPEAGGGPNVTLGQQVGQNLYLRVQQGVGEQSTTNLILEYELTDWLRLQTNVVQGSSTQPSIFRRAQSTGGDLIFFFSY
jgi:autotransporter translocation and assembly factor TamB